MLPRTDRRDFLKATAAAGLGFWVTGVQGFDEKKSPNEKLNVAFVGAGGKGGSNIGGFKSQTVYALCDIDDKTLQKAGETHKEAKKYHDFREMLDKEQKNIDVVVVSTPDHTHAVAAAMALRLGKHVYCEKPLTHSMHEARVLRELAVEKKVATSMGNQGTALPGLRKAVETIQSGAIGPVRECHVWTNRPVWPQGQGRPTEEQEVPEHIKWDLWIGPAPMRPFHHGSGKGRRGTYHDFNWRGWWDFGTGALGDMGCHTANMAFMALKLGHPTAVEAQFAPHNGETYPAWSIVKYEFPERDGMPPLKLTWYDGTKDGKRNLPSSELFFGHMGKEEKLATSGSLFIGDKGMLFSPDDYGAEFRLWPAKDFKDYQFPSEKLPRSPGHYTEFINACKGGPVNMANFNYAGMLTEFILLGNLAIRAAKRLEWDGSHLKATNAPEMEQWIKREFRKGWTL
jgi:predicted dehydrogenase